MLDSLTLKGLKNKTQSFSIFSEETHTAMLILKEGAHLFLPVVLSCKWINKYLWWEIRAETQLQTLTPLYSITPHTFSILTL